MTVHRARTAISEPRFVDRFQAGHACAFEGVFDATVSAARTLALRVCGDATLAEDALQDAYLEIWRRSATYDPARGSITTWVMSIVRYRSIDVVRRVATREKHSYADDRGLDRLAAEGCVVEFVIQSDRARTLREAMPALPDEQRTVIELAFDAGLSHTEIADHAALRLGTVKSRVRIALATLRQVLPADMAEH